MRRAPPQPNQNLFPSPARAAVLSDDSPTVFAEGFYSPSLSTYGDVQQGLPWKSVREVIEMADHALKAKQRAAERALKRVDVLQQQGTMEKKLLKRAQRAEVDCGSLVDELQQLIQAKADVAQQRADLDRANALLMAERELLCEQLQVSPDNVNLCQAVSKVLATARRAKGLDAQLRLLAKCQRELLLQLEAQREATARAERAAQQLQAERQMFMQVLAEHGIAQPELPELLLNAAMSPSPSAAVPIESTARAESAAGMACSSSSLSNSSAALMAQLMLMRVHSAGAGSCQGSGMMEYTASSPHALLTPGTPPVQDLPLPPQASPPMAMVRRSHSLDSGLNSLTGLLDQLALGQLCGSEEDTDHLYDDAADSESWGMTESMSMSADMDPWSVGVAAGDDSSSNHALAAAKELQHVHHQHQHHQQQHLQPVQEAPEDC